MIIGASPPELPPQLSPDGKWVWDGRQWQPVPTAAWEPAEVVMPGATAAKVAPAHTEPAASALTMPYSPPETYAAATVYSFPAAQPSTPLWEQPARTGVSLPLYFVAGAIVLMMAMLVLNSLNFIQLPWPGAAPNSSGPSAGKPSLPPLTVRSDYARADRFLNASLAPALVGVNQTLPVLKETCNGTLSNSCFNAITATDQQVKKVLSVIDHGDIPPCIATGMGKLRNDLAGMEGGLQLALQGFKDNQVSQVTQGLYRFGYVGQALPDDARAVDQAQKTQCSTQEIGP